MVYEMHAAESGKVTVTAAAATATPEPNTTNDSASLQLEVIGLGLSTEELFLGAQQVGTSGPVHALRVTNRAATAVVVQGIVLGGAPDFQIESDGCSGVSLAAGAACEVGLRFAPTAGGERTGTLTVSSSTPKVSAVSARLLGVGTLQSPTPDRSAPTIALAGVPHTLTPAALRSGFSIRVTPNEPSSLDVTLAGGARPGALASADPFDLRLFEEALPLAPGTRTIRVRPKKRLIGKIRKKTKVSLQVRATDAAGNVGSTAREIVVKPKKKKRRR
jgi:hypothetical protein